MSERYYDDVIAPQLRKIADDCKDHGISFLALCEWKPGDYGRTELLQPDIGIGLRICAMAARANGNVDGLMIGLARHVHGQPHSSMVLNMMGVPPEPHPAASSPRGGRG